MKSTLLRISKFIDDLVDWLGRKVSWLTTVLVVLICADVIMRYLFSATKTWILELEWHIFSVIFLIGASYTLLHDKHVRVDLFYEKMSPTKRRWVDLAGIVFFLLPWCVVVMHTSLDYTLNSFSFRETSSQPNGLPARYLIKGVILIAFSLLFLQALSLAIQSIFQQQDK